MIVERIHEDNTELWSFFRKRLKEYLSVSRGRKYFVDHALLRNFLGIESVKNELLKINVSDTSIDACHKLYITSIFYVIESKEFAEISLTVSIGNKYLLPFKIGILERKVYHLQRFLDSKKTFFFDCLYVISLLLKKSNVDRILKRVFNEMYISIFIPL